MCNLPLVAGARRSGSLLPLGFVSLTLAGLMACTTAQICILKACDAECDQMWFEARLLARPSYAAHGRCKHFRPSVQADAHDCPCPSNTSLCKVLSSGSSCVRCSVAYLLTTVRKTLASAFAATNLLRSGQRAQRSGTLAATNLSSRREFSA